MGVTKSNAYQCDFCSKVLIAEGALPVGWVRRVCNRPLGHGVFTSLAGESEALIFCCDAHEVEWLQEQRIIAMPIPISVLRELCAIGNGIAVGYCYGVHRRQDDFGDDKIITWGEELKGYLVTEKQLYSLRCALHDARPYLEDTDA